MIKWFTRASIELSFARTEDCVAAGGELLQTLSRRLRRQRPREVGIDGHTLVFEGPIVPKWRWPLQLWAVPRAAVRVSPNEGGLQVDGELEMRGPLYVFAFILAGAVVLVFQLEHVGALNSLGDWLGASAGFLLLAIVGASIRRQMSVFALKYHIEHAYQDVEQTACDKNCAVEG
jgi:hypothetical protein